ncbi:MAG: hypothetical protein WCF47_17125 [Pseudolabrys sp.]
MSNIIWCDRNVRFGSKTDMCGAQADVRFVPIADIQIVGLSRNETPGTLPGVFHGLGQLHLNVEFKASNRAGIAVQLAAKFYPKKRRRRATQFLLWLSVKCKRTLIASLVKGIAYRRR